MLHISIMLPRHANGAIIFQLDFNLSALWQFIMCCKAEGRKSEKQESNDFAKNMKENANKLALITHNESWSPYTACLQWLPHRELLGRGTSGLQVSGYKKSLRNHCTYKQIPSTTFIFTHLACNIRSRAEFKVCMQPLLSHHSSASGQQTHAAKAHSKSSTSSLSGVLLHMS